MVTAENAEWGGHMGEVVPSRAFFSFFGYFNVHSLAYAGFPLNAPKTCFGGGNVPLGSVLQVRKDKFRLQNKQ